MPACKNPSILFQCRDSSGCDFLHQMAEINLKDSITILGWRTVHEQQNLCPHAKMLLFYWMEKLQWLWFLARNGRNQSQGQYHYPRLDDSPEQQKLCPHAKILPILFQWRDSSGSDFLQGMAEFSLKDSITILGWRTVLRNKIYARTQKCCYFIWMEKLQWLWFLARNGRIQSQGQYHYPGLVDSPEEQNLCLHAKILLFCFNAEIPVAVISCTKWQKSISRTVSLSWAGWQSWGTKSMPTCKNPAILFEWRNFSGCDFLQGMAEINLKDSITILRWRAVLRNKSLPARKNWFILFQLIDSRGCDFLQGMAEFSLKDSITILGWRTVIQCYAHSMPKGVILQNSHTLHISKADAQKAD